MSILDADRLEDRQVESGQDGVFRGGRPGEWGSVEQSENGHRFRFLVGIPGPARDSRAPGRKRHAGAFSLIPIEFDDSDVEVLEDAALPADWRAHPVPVSTQKIGDRWTVESRSAVLRIPSVIVAHESNYLLNPAHPRFREIAIGKPRRFPLDGRLMS